MKRDLISANARHDNWEWSSVATVAGQAGYSSESASGALVRETMGELRMVAGPSAKAH